jgi:ABC-2 type transport system ATP-binding protein
MIAVDHVSKSFGPVRALEDITLQIGRGERVAFVGANGSGKTTLLRAMLGLTRVSGKVTLFGIDVARAPERALARVAYIPQIAPPLEAPVKEVISSIASLRGIAGDAVIRRARGLGLDVDTCASARFRDLSGGMKQKLLAAIALATEPELLICDEPMANLDVQARERFAADLNDAPSDRTIVLCSHRDEEVSELVGRVVALGEGRLLSDRARSLAAPAPPVLPPLRTAGAPRHLRAMP